MGKNMRCVIAVSCALIFSTQSKAQQVRYVRYAWPKVPGAVYYQGSLMQGSETTTVRTTEEWIILPEGSALDLIGHDTSAKSVGPVTLTVFKEALPPRDAASKVETFKPLESRPVAPKSTLTPPVAAKPDQNPVRTVPAKGLNRERGHADAAQSFLRIHLGLGHDQIQSKAGVFAYEGTSNIAPLTMAGAWAVPASPWSVAAELSFHSFHVASHIESLTGGETSYQTDRFTRLSLWFGGDYQLFAGGEGFGPQSLSVGTGISRVLLPALVVSDPVTGQATLQSTGVSRIGVRLDYHYDIAPLWGLGLRLGFAPVALDSEASSDGSAFQFYGTYRVKLHHSFEWQIVTTADFFSQKSLCDQGVACRARATSTSRVSAAQIGYTLSGI